jgi:predicted transcriptional regulator of viral defense system
MARKTSPDHRKLYQFAEPQAGYFTARQARAAGFMPSVLTYHVKASRFNRVAHGVYRLSQFPTSPFEDLYIAWLQTGPDSAISHESALAVYELSDVLPGEVHVIIPRTGSRRRKGIRLHTHRLDADEIAQRNGLPVTTVPRTIADVAANGLPEEQVLQAIQEALERGLVTPEVLREYAKRRGGRGAHLIRKTLDIWSTE